ncbi:hypothetical protein FRACA_540001 [Frankia canadensis]|uniref:Uncharacterized protein n=1 Tax=Frankia canadensis TaxID=1836972 RepID=A0A2I2KYS3_9ACTN|nr:hypothetical protein FRACA_540001 [Frankia canadensis]SOU58105.1 hypothetical protein FRACA_540001 [Frankia canadensis]
MAVSKPGRRQLRNATTWMELLTTSGPFLTLPVVRRVWPDGLTAVPTATRARARVLVAELLVSGGGTRDAVVPAVLRELLDWGDRLALAGDIPDAMAVPVVEHRQVVRADFAFRAVEGTDDSAEDDEEFDEDASDSDEEPAGPAGEWRMLGMVAPWGAHPLTRRAEGGWVASPVERLAVLLRAHNVPVGLVTDGRCGGRWSGRRSAARSPPRSGMPASGARNLPPWRRSSPSWNPAASSASPTRTCCRRCFRRACAARKRSPKGSAGRSARPSNCLSTSSTGSTATPAAPCSPASATRTSMPASSP